MTWSKITKFLCNFPFSFFGECNKARAKKISLQRFILLQLHRYSPSYSSLLAFLIPFFHSFSYPISRKFFFFYIFEYCYLYYWLKFSWKDWSFFVKFSSVSDSWKLGCFSFSNMNLFAVNWFRCYHMLLPLHCALLLSLEVFTIWGFWVLPFFVLDCYYGWAKLPSCLSFNLLFHKSLVF